MLTGQWLFRAATEGEEIFKCLEGVVEAPSARNPSVPTAFDAIVMRGLARDPAQRYATARDMASDLERAAPAIRASELGVWVASLASEVLTARAAVIADMEKLALGSEGGAQGLPLVTGVASQSSPRVEYAGDLSQASHAGVVTERIPSAGTAPRWGSNRRFTLVALAGLLALGVYAAFSLNLRSSTRGAADEAPGSVAASVPPPAVTAIPPAPSASFAPHPAAAPDPPAALGLPAAPDPSAAAPAVAPNGNVKPDKRSTTKRIQSSSCNPPYFIDPQGREVFKVQCL
jgi:serine/threonine-protein kinase